MGLFYFRRVSVRAYTAARPPGLRPCAGHSTQQRFTEGNDIQKLKLVHASKKSGRCVAREVNS